MKRTYLFSVADLNGSGFFYNQWRILFANVYFHHHHHQVLIHLA